MKKKSIAFTAIALSVLLTACAQSPVQGPVNSGISDKTETAGKVETTEDSQAGDSQSVDDLSGSVAEENAEATDDVTAKDDSGTESDGNTTAAGMDGDSVSVQEPAGDGSSADWKRIYLDFIKNELAAITYSSSIDELEGWTGGFFFINDDEIPEMIISSGYEAAGNVITTVINGKACYMQTSRLGLKYIPRGNVIDNADGHMGYNFDHIYTIGEKGFDIAGIGEYNEIINDEGYTGGFEYFWEGTEVTEEEYNRKVNGFIPYNDAFYFCTGTPLEYVISYLDGFAPTDFVEAYTGLYEKGFVADYMDNTYPAFCVMDRESSAPTLLASSSETFALCSFNDGLLLVGPTSYFMSDSYVLIYPGLGMVENMETYENSVFDSFYYLGMGIVYSKYFEKTEKYNSAGELEKDAEGNQVYKYSINRQEVDSAEYFRESGKYSEDFKFQYAPYDADETYCDYISGDALEYELMKRR